jgi:DNA-binding PadR family transcriptional regulator
VRPEVKPTRRTRRVLLVLLTGASNLGGYTISHLAGVNSGLVYLTLDRLEDAGWVTSDREERFDGKPRGRFYRLSRQGRAKAIGLLGLEGTGGRDA